MLKSITLASIGLTLCLATTLLYGNAFEKGGQRAWYHDPGFTTGYFHTYDQLQLENEAAFKAHIYVPRNYEQDQSQEFPLLIVFDGDTAFFNSPLSGQTLGFQNALAGFQWQNPNAPLPIIAALVPNNRSKEYTHKSVIGQECCELNAFISKLTDKVLPWLKETYRITDNPSYVGVSGSSHGGLAAFATAMLHPDKFGYVIAQSPSFWVGFESSGNFAGSWRRGTLANAIRNRFSYGSEGSKPRVWIDWGLVRDGQFHNNFIEANAAKRSQQVIDFLQDDLNYKPGENLHWMIDEFGQHDEGSWSKRLVPALEAVSLP